MTTAIERKSNTYLYQQVIVLIREMQDAGTLRAGEKLPSLRMLASKLAVSIPTIKQAYMELEYQDIIEARPKSGYYLKASKHKKPKPKKSSVSRAPIEVSRQQLIEQVYEAIHRPGSLPLGIANPIAALPPSKMLARIMRRVTSMAGNNALNYGPTTGYPPLRRLLAYRYLDFGMQVTPEQLLVTNGAQEAISIALQCVAKAGDVIAVESPCYFGVLELIENLGMMALEIPLCPDNGIAASDVAKAIAKHPIKACIISTAVSNPLGSYTPDLEKKKLVSLLEAHNIPLIEDDVYGDLYFTNKRGIPAQHYSQKGLVLTCSSFSKTAAPSYRVGWLLAPNHIEHATKLKRALSCSASLMNQWAIAEFISSGEYDRYIRHLREILRCNKERMIAKIHAHFPDETRVSIPQGGTVVWVEFPKQIDATNVFQLALEQNISISPGALFSPSNKFRHCARISYGQIWSTEMESAMETLGDICHQLCKDKT